MKQKLILSMLALALGILPAIANEPLRIFLNAGTIEHVHVQNNMEVVLLQAPSDSHSIMLDEVAAEKLNLRLNNNTLTISERRTDNRQKMVVYLYVTNLKSLTVEGNSEIKTFGSLETGKLDVFVDGNAKVHIRTTGTVKAHSLNDAELNVKYLSNSQVAKRGY